MLVLLSAPPFKYLPARQYLTRIGERFPSVFYYITSHCIISAYITFTPHQITALSGVRTNTLWARHLLDHQTQRKGQSRTYMVNGNRIQLSFVFG